MLGNSWKARAIRAGLPWFALGQALVVRLTGTPFGVLILSAALYWWTAHYTSVTPLRLPELLSTVAGETEHWLTFLGVVVAYAAISTWKDEKRTEIRMAAGSDIAAFFQGASDTTHAIGTAADDLLELQRLVIEGAPNPDLLLQCNLIFERRAESLAAREQLNAAAVAVYSLQGRHTVVLNTSAIATYAFHKANRRLQRLNSIVWFPMLDWAQDPLALVRAVAVTNPAQWLRWKRGQLPNTVLMMMWSATAAHRFGGTLFRPAIALVWVLRSQLRQLRAIPIDPEDEKC